MSSAITKRSVMTLFSGDNDMSSHQVRIVLAEKGVTVDIVSVDPDEVNEELAGLNPYHSVPTLVDRDLLLYTSRIVLEYLDERFPHPPLMPVYPVARGNSRLMMHRIELEWYSLAHKILQGVDVEASREALRNHLLEVAPIFGVMPFFMSTEFGLVDCYMAPLLWRLPSLGIDLSGRANKDIKAYMKRLFERESFQASLTQAERAIYQGV